MNKKVTAIILVAVMILSFTLPVSAAAMSQITAAQYLLEWAGYTEADAQAAGGWYELIDQTELIPADQTFTPEAPCSNNLFEAMRRRACELYDIKHSSATEPSVPETTEPEATEPPADVIPIITITEQPADVSAAIGDSAAVQVCAFCTTGAALRYQWYKDGTAISGATDAVCSVPTAERGTSDYHCVISADGAESVTTDTAQVQVRLAMVFEEGLAQPIITYTSGKSSGCNSANSDIVRFCVYVETDYDTDSDGKLDLIKVLVQLPRAAMEGDYQAPVIYEARPYVAGTTNSVTASSGSYNINSLYTQVSPRVSRGTAATEDVVASAVYTDWYYTQGYENLDWYDYFLVRGYAVVTAAGPGTLGSEGFETCGSDLEIDAFAAVIEWLEGTQGRAAYTDKTSNISIEADWSNGQIGMTGRSYAGTTQFGLATTGVKGLETVVPVAGIASWYEYVCSQGIPTRDVGYTDYLAGYCASRYFDSKDWSKISTNYRKYLKQLDTDEKALNGDYGDHWAVRDYTLNAENIQCSALIVHGMNDSNVRPKNTAMMYEAFRKAGADVRLLLTQDSHRTPAYGSEKTEMLIDGESYHDILNQWFTYHLCDDVTEGVDSIAAVTVQNNTDGSWSYYDSWESEDHMTISLSPNKQLSSGTTTTANYVSGNTSYSVVQNVSVTSDLTIKGTVAVTVEATPGTAGKNLMLSAMLVDVSDTSFGAFVTSGTHVPTTTIKTNGLDIGGGAEPYDIIALKQTNVKQKVIAAGWMDLANPNAGYDSASAVSTGNASTTRNTYTIYLQPSVYTVKAGHRLALVVYTRDSSVSTSSTSYKVTVHSATADIPLAAPYAASLSVNYGADAKTGVVTADVANGSLVESNSSVTTTASPKSGYVFSGWKVNGVSVPGDSTHTFVVTENTTIEAVFTKSTGRFPWFGIFG